MELSFEVSIKSLISFTPALNNRYIGNCYEEIMPDLGGNEIDVLVVVIYGAPVFHNCGQERV